MSKNQKCLNLIRGGGQQFSKMSEIQKSLKFPMGRGVKPIWEFFPNFSVFFYDGSPMYVDVYTQCLNLCLQYI